MFDAMPTPRSDVENYCYGHTTPVQSSCVHGESANLGEQPVDEVPESYGFNNLSSHSVFLADGTECIYYALPENFALERVVPEPVFVVYDDKPDDCSNEFVHVFTSTPEEHSHEEEKQETEQLLRCFSKQQDDERACNCPVLKAYNSDVTRSTQLCTAPSVTELRLLWDPGALHMHSGITINSTRTTTDTEWSKFSSPTSCELPQSASVQWSILSAQHFLDSTMKKGSIFSAGRPLPWDQWSAILLLHHGLWEFSRPAKRLKWDNIVHVILHPYTATHPIGTCPGILTQGLQPIFTSAFKCSSDFGLGWIELKAILTQCSKSVQVTEWRHPLEFLLMAETLHNLSKLREVQLNCSGMNVGLSFIQFLQTSCEWIHKIITAVSVRPLIELHHSYGRLYTKTASLDGLDIEEQPTYMCHSTMLNSSKLLRHMVTVLSCSLASFGNRSNLQWDPGIAFVYQQGVHKDYNAPNLLPTQNCLQILEMNIIFVTFLPP
jgi:hypothetical protein